MRVTQKYEGRRAWVRSQTAKYRRYFLLLSYPQFSIELGWAQALYLLYQAIVQAGGVQ